MILKFKHDPIKKYEVGQVYLYKDECHLVCWDTIKGHHITINLRSFRTEWHEVSDGELIPVQQGVLLDKLELEIMVRK